MMYLSASAMSVFCAAAVALATTGASSKIVSGAVVAATNSLPTQNEAITRTMVSAVETNLSHFIPQLLSEARAAEREAIAEGFKVVEQEASIMPTAATVDLFVDDVFTA
ncbi:hypothetical protein LPJ64_005776 [Coemansia asiatica]|uniref:Antifreeze protein n=1 Tax=Coemansia asiatica TaxID=1052880 RepID=A0A9W7XDS3_9FUNG|nr:hypothetical protein LPJ64_005776 [Coemansia asiatica]